MDIEGVSEAILKFAAANISNPGHINQGLVFNAGLCSTAEDVAAVLNDAEASLHKRIFTLEHAAARYTAIHRAQLQRLQSRLVADRKLKNK